MNIWLQRFSSRSDTTLGLLIINSEFECFTLEDESRNIKVAGETRIPEGVYYIKKREVNSPLTKRYQSKYDFFDYHLMVQNVEGFEYVYIHVGNDDDHTEGCILVGDQAVNNNVTEDNNLLQSANAFKRVYEKISQALNNNEEVLLKVTSHG